MGLIPVNAASIPSNHSKNPDMSGCFSGFAGSTYETNPCLSKPFLDELVAI